MYLCRCLVVLPLFFWVLPRENLHSLKKSYVGAIVFQKVLSRRQYLCSPTNNYCSVFIELSFFPLRWIYFFASCLGNTHKYDIYHFSLFTLFEFSILWDALLVTFLGYHLFWCTLVSLSAPIWYLLALFVETKSLISQPTRQPTKLGPVFFIRKTYLFHRSGGDARSDCQKLGLSNVVFCNKYNEILFFLPRRPSKCLHVCMSLNGRFTFIFLSAA